MPPERLQKILSAAGVASRRKAEQMIVEGRVTVNGSIITELGSKADLDQDHIKVDGKLVRRPRNLIYLALHKPLSCVTTVLDPEGRPTVMDLMRGVKERVYPVGRLDYHSEGLLLLTNDGEFANAVTSASTHLPKTYLVKANGTLTNEQEEAFRNGIPLSGKRTAAAGLKLLHRAQNPWYEVRLYEGRNNQIRVMFKHFGFLVEKLKRVQIGFLELGALKPGEFRYLTPVEVARLEKLLRPKAGASRARGPEGPAVAERKPAGTKVEAERAEGRKPREVKPHAVKAHGSKPREMKARGVKAGAVKFGPERRSRRVPEKNAEAVGKRELGRRRPEQGGEKKAEKMSREGKRSPWRKT